MGPFKHNLNNNKSLVVDNLETQKGGAAALIVHCSLFIVHVFSGHCGILALTSCEWYALKKYKIFYANLFALIFTAFGLLALNAHYFIDITTGIIVAHWIFFIIWEN